jgi:hypothetical protein
MRGLKPVTADRRWDVEACVIPLFSSRPHLSSRAAACWPPGGTRSSGSRSVVVAKRAMPSRCRPGAIKAQGAASALGRWPQPRGRGCWTASGSAAESFYGRDRDGRGRFARGRCFLPALSIASRLRRANRKRLKVAEIRMEGSSTGSRSVRSGALWRRRRGGLPCAGQRRAALNAGMGDILKIVRCGAIRIQRGCDRGDFHVVPAVLAGEEETR